MHFPSPGLAFDNLICDPIYSTWRRWFSDNDSWLQFKPQQFFNRRFSNTEQ